MKFTKMSLVAALLVGSSAFAIDNVKFAGDAKLFYSTDDSDVGIFAKEQAVGQAALGFGVTADLNENVTTGAHLTALSTLGLEGQLVNGVWEGTNGVDDYYWMDEAWLAATLGKTTVKVGRMQLDTPLVFSESWSIATNSFEAAAVVNQDIADTTLVGAYVGGSNGSVENGTGGFVIAGVNANGTTNFSQFHSGAFAAGVVNNSVKALTLQAWYYNATHILGAYWLQADISVDGILAGAQYTSTDPDAAGADTTDAYAVMVGYEIKDLLTAKVSYSQVSQEGSAGANLSGSGMSKLYTESWYTFIAAQQDTTAYNVTVEAPIADVVDLGLYYTYADQDKRTGGNDLSELTVTASKSYGSLDASLAYINTVAGNQDNDAVNTLQVYLTYNY
jgi:hypothetical protein